MTARELIDTLMAELDKVANSQTIMGEPMTLGEATVVPVLRVSVGVGAGSGGGGAGGVRVGPAAFIVHQHGEGSIMAAPNVASADEPSGALIARAEGTASMTATNVADPSVNDAIDVRLSRPVAVGAYAEEFPQFTNEARAEVRRCGDASFEGAEPLTLDDALHAAAQKHSEDQPHMDGMTHVGSDGSNLRIRVNAEGYF